MIKKWLSILLAGLLAALPGCSGQPEREEAPTERLNPDNPVAVTLWHYYAGENQQALENAVSVFNRTIGIDRGVVVDAVAMGGILELEDNITQSALGVINSRPMPQIFSSYPDKAIEIDALGMLEDIGQHLTEEEKALYEPGFLDDGILNGRLLLFPVAKSTELLYVNATAWNAFAEKEGLTAESLATWESIYDTARAYYRRTDAEAPGSSWDGGAMMGFDSVANFLVAGGRQLGVELIDAAADQGGRVILDEEVLRRLFDIYYRGTVLGYFGAAGRFRSDDVKASKLIAYVGSSSSAGYFPTWIERDGVKHPIDFLALPYPVFRGGDAWVVRQGAGMCVAKSTPAQLEGSMLFLRWFTEARQNIAFTMSTGYLPVRADAYRSDEFSSLLDTLRRGAKAQQNLAQIYDIILNQVDSYDTYAPKSFPGSYGARAILQSTLAAVTSEGRRVAYGFKVDGLTEEELLALLNPDARFREWIEALEAACAAAGVETVSRAPEPPG